MAFLSSEQRPFPVSIRSIAIFLLCVVAIYHLNNKPFVLSTTGGHHGPSRNVSYQKAFDESFGFFTDIPDSIWDRKKQLVKDAIHVTDTPTDVNATKSSRDAVTTRFYNNNWNPDFACLMDVALGPVGDGHKWVCDAYRLKEVKDCLVYSIGSRGDFQFERALQKEAPNCEIHIFDPEDFTAQLKKSSIQASFHAWGLSSSYTKLSIPAKLKGRPLEFKTLSETMTLLEHVDRPITLFKIDCEGCEWKTYKDWLKHDIRQILVETHGLNSDTRSFFQEIKKAGYVMFHKEPNLLMRGTGVEFAFLKLSSTFFL